jgi:hypothetical protein
MALDGRAEMNDRTQAIGIHRRISVILENTEFEKIGLGSGRRGTQRSGIKEEP